jgi:hypothetical protein
MLLLRVRNNVAFKSTKLSAPLFGYSHYILSVLYCTVVLPYNYSQILYLFDTAFIVD